MIDITIKSTRNLFIVIIAALFAATLALALSSGIGTANALAWSILGVLAITYPTDLVPQQIAINSGLLLVADTLAAITFVILTAFLTATFYSFIRRVNLQRRGIMRRIRRLRAHVIITPFNGFAEAVIEELKSHGVESVVITGSERDARHLYAHSRLAVVGNAGNVDLLNAIGLHRAMGVVLCSDDTTENAIAAVTVRTFNRRVRVIARVTDEDDLPRLSKAGVHTVILPEVSAGTYIGNAIVDRLARG